MINMLATKEWRQLQPILTYSEEFCGNQKKKPVETWGFKPPSCGLKHLTIILLFKQCLCISYSSLVLISNKQTKKDCEKTIIYLLWYCLLRYIPKNLKHCLAYEMFSCHRILFRIHNENTRSNHIRWSELTYTYRAYDVF